MRDRFLTGILAGIGVLVLAALILFFIRREPTVYMEDESSPAAVVQNYMLALQQRNYERAYAYLADSSGKPDLTRFRQPFLTFQSEEINNILVEVGETMPDTQAGTALVQVVLVRGGTGLFAEPYREQQVFGLVMQSGKWKINAAPYPFWSYDWYLPATPKAAPIK